MCWRTVPHTDSSDRMKLRAEGGKPQTVIQVSRGERSGELLTSWWVVLRVLGGERRLVLLRLMEAGLETLLGLKRREVVGGPPVFSLAGLEELRFSLRRAGPLRGWLGMGVWGVERGGWVEMDLLSLLGETMGRWEEGVLGDCITGSPIRKPGRYPEPPAAGWVMELERGVCWWCWWYGWDWGEVSEREWRGGLWYP